MTDLPLASYGSWPSPLSARQVTAGALRFDHLTTDGEAVYWVEGRASDSGRSVVVRGTIDGQITDVTGPEHNVRTRVHEYGGAAYVVHEGTLYFANFADQRLYRQPFGGVATPLTVDGFSYAYMTVDASRARLWAVREDRSDPAREPVNTIVTVALDGPPSAGTVVVSGADFYSDPVLNADATRLAWLEWRHPNMPWDGTTLWTADVASDGTLTRARAVAGGAAESIFQPRWSPDGTLLFVSDRSGFWNLYRSAADGVTALWPMAAEFGKPQWSFSQTTYAIVSATELVVSYTEDGRWRLARLSLSPPALRPFDVALQPLDGVTVLADRVFFIGGSATEPTSIVSVELEGATATVVRASTSHRIAREWIAIAEAIGFESGGRDVHAFYYPPVNPTVCPPAGERPPLLVLSHGGPTGATSDVLDEELQFWTSRGFAVLDVNYSGSTGYGRAYRERLNGQWGIVDVADCVNGAQHLVREGLADPARLLIRGGSAGGYTTLAALTFHDTFRAGASYYGISDIEVLARDTHKFESRYLDSLIGPYPAMRQRYRDRSPIHAIDRLSAALILFQGLEDQVVPPNQAEMMADAARRKGLPVAYVPFAGEQHGFRRAENIVRSLEAELYFYGAVCGFSPADHIEPVLIDNLPAPAAPGAPAS